MLNEAKRTVFEITKHMQVSVQLLNKIYKLYKYFLCNPNSKNRWTQKTYQNVPLHQKVKKEEGNFEFDGSNLSFKNSWDSSITTSINNIWKLSSCSSGFSFSFLFLPDHRYVFYFASLHFKWPREDASFSGSCPRGFLFAFVWWQWFLEVVLSTCSDFHERIVPVFNPVPSEILKLTVLIFSLVTCPLWFLKFDIIYGRWQDI